MENIRQNEAMKKTQIERIPCALPEEINKICSGVRLFDSSCSSAARVYYIERDGGYYLKLSDRGSLQREATMTEYFHQKGLGGELLYYSCDFGDENDILLTRAVIGEDCTAEKYLSEPSRLADILGENLRALHETDFSDCPVQDRLSEYFALAEHNYRTGNYNKEHFPDSFGYSSAEEAYRVLTLGKDILKNRVLIHGDYCLPNVMLNGWSFSGVIDLGNAGVGDRHIDLFWGQWSIGFNLQMTHEINYKKYAERFLDAYGREKINKEALSVVRAAEVFG